MSQHPQWEDVAGISLFYLKADNKHISQLNNRFHAESKADRISETNNEPKLSERRELVKGKMPARSC